MFDLGRQVRELVHTAPLPAARELVKESADWTADDLALKPTLWRAQIFATIAVAEALDRIARKLDEITDGEGSVNVWTKR